MKFYVKNIFQKEVLLKVYLKIGEFLTGNKNTGVDIDKQRQNNQNAVDYIGNK